MKQSYRPELEALSAEMHTLVQPFEASGAVPEQVRQQLKPLLTQHDATTQSTRRDIYAGIQNQIGLELDAIQQFIEQTLGGQVTHRIVLVNALAVTLPSAQLGALANRAEVAFIEPNRPVHPCLDSSVPAMGADTLIGVGFLEAV